MRRNYTAKLNELRAKTDRQLVDLIRSRIERGLALAREVSNDEARAYAEQAHREAQALLPLLTAADRGELEPLLADLDYRLAARPLRVQTAWS
jgi:hypothetical protein